MSERKPWTPPNEKMRAVYEHYLAGSERGDLYVYFKRGRMGIMRPERSLDNALAAWMAGRDSVPSPSLESPQP